MHASSWAALASILGLSGVLHWVTIHVISKRAAEREYGVLDAVSTGTPFLSRLLPVWLQRHTAHLGPWLQELCSAGVLLYMASLPALALLWLLGLAVPSLRWVPPTLAGGQATVQLMIISVIWLSGGQGDWRRGGGGPLRALDVAMYKAVLKVTAAKDADLLGLHDVVFDTAAQHVGAIIPQASYVTFFLLTPRSRARLSGGEPGQKHMNVTALLGPASSMPPLLHIPLVHNTMVADVLAQGRSMVFSAQAQTSRHHGDLAFLARVAGVSCVLCMPAYVGMELIGAFQLGFETTPSGVEQVQADGERIAQILAATVRTLEPALPRDNPVLCDSEEAAQAWAARYQVRMSTGAQPAFLFATRAAAAAVKRPASKASAQGLSSSSAKESSSQINASSRSVQASVSDITGSLRSQRSADLIAGNDMLWATTLDGESDSNDDDTNDSLFRVCRSALTTGTGAEYINSHSESEMASGRRDDTHDLNVLAPPTDERPAKELKLFECIGKGGFAKVYRGLWGGQEVAVKVIALELYEDCPKQGLQEEAKALLEAAVSWTMRHPNVVRTYTYLPNFDAGDGGRDAEGGIAIIMEYCDLGTLIKALDHQMLLNSVPSPSGHPVQKVNMPVVIATLDDIAAALEHLHMLKIVHRDLKLRNILMKSDPHDFRGWSVRLADFGLSMMLADNLHVSREAAGTVQYMAPELLAQGQVTWQSDVYALGIIMWELFHSTRVFAGIKKPQIMYMVIQHAFRPTFSSACPRSYRELVNRCWHQDWRQRPTCSQIRQELRAIAADLHVDVPVPAFGLARSPELL